MKKKEKKEPTSMNVKIPMQEYKAIKEHASKHNYKIGGFVTSAAIEKIEKEKIK
jgi:uncharacterized protein (DUF1778 family)